MLCRERGGHNSFGKTQKVATPPHSDSHNYRKILVIGIPVFDALCDLTNEKSELFRVHPFHLCRERGSNPHDLAIAGF